MLFAKLMYAIASAIGTLICENCAPLTMNKRANKENRKMLNSSMELGMSNMYFFESVLENAYATAASTRIAVELEKWTRDFNSGNVTEVCSLFAPDLISNFRGAPEDTYKSLCANLQTALEDPAKTYHYDLDIKEIMVSGELAVVRLVWTLKIRPKNGPEETKQEPGLDIFRREADGSWKITRYMAYEAP